MENQYRKKEKERDFLIDSYMLLQRTVKTVFLEYFSSIFAIFNLYPAKEQAKGLLSKRVTGIFTHFLQKTTYKIPLKGILDSFNIKFTLKTEV